MEAQVLDICVKIFNEVLALCMYFLVPLFLVRVIFASVSGNSNDIFNSLKGVVFFFVLVYAFEPILETLFSFTTSVGKDISLGLASKIQKNYSPFSRPLVDQMNFMAIQPWGLKILLEGVMVVLYWVGVSFYFAFMAVLSCLAPIVFLMSCVSDIGIGVKVFFTFLVLASSWPVIWIGLDIFLKSFGSQMSSELGRSVLEIFVSFFKLSGPIWFASLAVNSGSVQKFSRRIIPSEMIVNISKKAVARFSSNSSIRRNSVTFEGTNTGSRYKVSSNRGYINPRINHPAQRG